MVGETRRGGEAYTLYRCLLLSLLIGIINQETLSGGDK